MRLFRRSYTIVALSGALALSMSAVAGAEPGGGCTVFGGPPGQFVSFVAQEVGHSADVNPGNAKNPAPPFVPGVVGCNPTGNPTPPA